MSARRVYAHSLAALIFAASLTPALRAGSPPVPVERMEAPALDVLETSVTALSASRTPLPQGGSVRQSVLETDFEFTRRLGLRGPWYLAFGASYESFHFGRTAGGLPDKLQGLAAIMAVQYIVQDHVAAILELRPGFYAGGELTSDALDVPVLAYAPIPLRSDLFLLLGARASGVQTPVVAPIGGLIWLIRDNLRLEAVFPRSQFVYSPSERWEYQVVAEIAGDGFRADRDPALPARLRGAAIEYSEYRAGAGFSFTPYHGAAIGLDAGYVFERSLDFFRARLDLRSSGSAYLRLQGSLEF